jgi:uncharacterized protein
MESTDKMGSDAGSSRVSSNNDIVPPPPARYKMAIIMTGIIFALLNSLLPVIRQLTVGLPILLSSFVGVPIMVLLMMYVIIPLLTKLLRPWLTKKRLF